MKIAAFFLACGMIFAQAPTVIQGPDVVSTSRAVINQNFLNLYNTNTIPSVLNFGADPTGVRDSLAALNSAEVFEGGNMIIPAGSYTISGQFNITRSYSSIICQPGAVISYSGSADIPSMFYVYVNPNIVGVTIVGCSFKANSHITSAMVYANGAQQLLLYHLLLSSNSNPPPAGCILLFNGNTNKIDSPECDGTLSAPNPKAALVGIEFRDEFDSSIFNMKIEQITNEGLKFSHNGGVACGNNTIIGGNAEGNGTGISNGSSCSGNVFIGVDTEVSSVVGVLESGAYSKFINTGNGDLHVTSSSFNSVFDGGQMDSITIDSGARYMNIQNASYNNSGSGSYSDSGTLTKKIGVYHVGVGLDPDINPRTQFIGLSGGSNNSAMLVGQSRSEFAINNAGECTASITPGCSSGVASANNSIKAYLLKPDGSNVAAQGGLVVSIALTHSLQAGANTLNLNDSGSFPIQKPTNGGNLTIPFSGSGHWAQFYLTAGNTWDYMGSQ